ncbi:immunoglobulin domain-containing protein [Paractinoplanes deccanensis]|uniref:immunoglobulin domain-containing protein n=1 Tax=Paractinoplanes deccanensis TaxID=113561 RepID=UPI0019452BCA|nr:immunoglobulin domain-containing protein [Actinoplanes deccanensis]
MRSRYPLSRAAHALVAVITVLVGAAPAAATRPTEAAATPPTTKAEAATDTGFTAQPQPQTAPDGSAVTFSATYPGAVLYTWYRTDAAGTKALPGNAATYTFTATYADNGATYSVRVFDSAFVQHRSDEAKLTVTPVAATVTEPPHDASVQAYQSARFTVTAGGTSPYTYQWQRLTAGTWADIAGASKQDYAFKTAPADDGAQFRVLVGNAYGPRIASAPARLDVTSGGGSLDPVAHASLEWGINTIYQGGNPANSGCNFFSAGTQAPFQPRQGNVRIVHRLPDGSAQGISDATKCIPGSGTQLNQRALFTEGAGTANPVTGEATIKWTGAFTANAYSGMVTWYLKDPVLTIAADGTGTLTATSGGMGSSRANPGTQEPIAARTVTVATFDQVLLTTTGAQISPSFAGVDYFPLVDGKRSTTSAISDTVKKAEPGWGSWPQSFVDFQYETGLSTYWHSSGLAGDADKLPLDITVGFNAAPVVKDVPVILANPSTAAAQPYVEGRGLTVTADVDGDADLRWERASSAAGPWTAIDGATTETLTIAAVDSSWNGTYVRVVATNGDGRAVSTAVRLSTAPYAAPAFAKQPADVVAVAGNRAVVSFQLTGNPAIDAGKVTLERSDDKGATWTAWTGVTATTADITIAAVPADANGAQGRVVAENVEGARTTSGVFSFRVFASTGKPQLVVLPDGPVDPGKETALTIVGAGFPVPDWASATQTYSLDVGLFDAQVWQPGKQGTRDWVATSPDSSSGQIYHDWMAMTGGTFTIGLRVPAGKLQAGHTYGIGAFLRLTDISTWQDTFGNRSLDAWTPIRLTTVPADGSQEIVVEVPEQQEEPGEFLWTIDATDRTVTLSTAENKGDYLQSTGDLKPVKVTDTRAGGPAWSVSGVAGPFTGGLPASYLGWTPAVATAGAGAQAGTAVTAGDGDGLGASATLGYAADGHAKGTAVLGARMDLRLPVTTAPGTYSTMLTLTALS